MSGRVAGWSAWGLWAITVVAMASTVVLVAVNEASPVRDSAFVAVLILAFSSVGALIASRRPENSIGWLFLSGALFWAVGELALEYAVYVLFTAPGALPLGAWAGWFGDWARGMGWLLAVLLLLLLFPTGRLPSPRWRPVAWAAGAFLALFTLVVWLSPVSQDLRLASVGNPMGIEWGAMNALREVLYVALLLLLLACGASTALRFRRSGGEERQQLKWFAYAVGVMVSLFAAWFSLALAGIVTPDVLMWTIPLLGLPVAVGVAVLRHRLYDIDVVINRTLVYGSLTVSLALVYAGCVASLQYVFRALTGGESQLAVVASTLAIAALFSPLRRGIQGFIDRRFYRKKYDAAKTLEELGARLRDETDLEALDDDLVAVARETVQPAHVSLWLREPDRSKPGNGGVR